MPCKQHQSLRFSLCALACAGALLGAAGAQAQTTTPADSAAAAAAPAAAPANPLSFNLGATTDYRYRGISQSHLDPAISGGIDYAAANGLYVGTWLSSIHWIRDAGGKTPVETDFYGGYRGNAGPLGYDVGLLRYQYINNRLHPSTNTTELYGALTWDVLTVKYSHSLTNLFGFDNSKNSGYLEAAATFNLPWQGWSVTPHAGHQWVHNAGDLSYTDYALTVTKDFGNGLALSGGVVGTDANKHLYVTPDGHFTGKTGLVASLKYTF